MQLFKSSADKDIQSLKEAAERICCGDFRYSVKIQSGGEMAALAKLISQMAADLSEYHDKNEIYKKRLQQLYEQREKYDLSKELLRKEIIERQRAEEELKKSQNQLIQSEKLAAVGQLVSGVAHELNNPLMAVSGYAELMLKYVEDEAVREDVQNLHKDTQRAINIVRNLLSFARKKGPERQLISINDVVQSVIDLQIYELNLDNIEVISQLDSGLPDTMADFQQLQQVFLNLVLNAAQAIKDTHRPGTLTIRTQQSENKLQTLFIDDGPGIPKKILGRIVEPFFTTKDVGKGTGLGLSICYGIIQRHGGNMMIQSEEGEGATFVVEIPIVAEKHFPSDVEDQPMFLDDYNNLFIMEDGYPDKGGGV